MSGHIHSIPEPIYARFSQALPGGISKGIHVAIILSNSKRIIGDICEKGTFKKSLEEFLKDSVEDFAKESTGDFLKKPIKRDGIPSTWNSC